MSLRKPPTLTPARLEANRRNARKSTGPRTARGKAQVRFNALKTGKYSRVYQDLWMSFFLAPPEGLLRMRSLLPPEMARHPLLAEALEIAIEAEIGTALHFKSLQDADASRRGRQVLPIKVRMLLKTKDHETP